MLRQLSHGPGLGRGPQVQGHQVPVVPAVVALLLAMDHPLILHKGLHLHPGPWLEPMILDSLPSEWDQSQEIRERMRNDMNLTIAFDAQGKESNEYVTATKEHVKLNACVLRPLAVLMAANDLLLPSIDKLIFAIEEYYVMAKRSILHEKAYHEAWSIRRLIGKLKRSVYRQCPPEDPKRV